MKPTLIFAALLTIQSVLSPALFGENAPAQAADPFRAAFAEKFAEAEKQNATVIPGSDGWLFLASECRMLSVGQFWGENAVKTSRCSNPDAADPIPAIVDFNEQLKQRGIALLLVPVPPKALCHWSNLLSLNLDYQGDPSVMLSRFYDELRTKGVDVLDLREIFRKITKPRGPFYCKTDTHWSGYGCVVAAEAIAEKIRSTLPAFDHKRFDENWEAIKIDGDLPAMLPTGTSKTEPEEIEIRKITEKNTDNAVTPDPNSPVLILGDSHTLVFHEFLAEKAGLLDQLAAELHLIPDLLGIRGSGATQVRKDLYRRTVKDRDYLAKKKVIVWCFTARDFTEADQGWQKVPVSK